MTTRLLIDAAERFALGVRDGVVAPTTEPTHVAKMVDELVGKLVEINDMTKPHHPCRHGRADIGWPAVREAV